MFLGVQYIEINNPNINNMKTLGGYFLTGTYSGTLPSGVSSSQTYGTFLKVIGSDMKQRIQIARFGGDNTVYLRIMDVDGSWYAWKSL